MMEFLSLGSGSKGNATVVRAGDTLLLVDCGFAKTEAVRRMRDRGIEPSNIDAVLVTHEHGDHAGGVGALARAFDVPVYMTHGTAATGRVGEVPTSVMIAPEQGFSIGDICVTAVPVPHDAREPVQFVFEANGVRLGILTDLGSISRHVIDCYSGCDALLLEFNHDTELLRSGPYPPALKRRVGGDWGHLNNHQAAAFLEAADTSRLHTLVVGHISEQNNSVAHAEAVIAGCNALRETTVVYAQQGDGFDWLSCCHCSDEASSLGATA